MGCGSSRSVPVATLLMLTQRVEKEHDDVSFPPCVVKKLKVPDIDAFLDDFEAVLGDVVYLNNALFDSLTDVRVSVALASQGWPSEPSMRSHLSSFADRLMRASQRALVHIQRAEMP